MPILLALVSRQCIAEMRSQITIIRLKEHQKSRNIQGHDPGETDRIDARHEMGKFMGKRKKERELGLHDEQVFP